MGVEKAAPLSVDFAVGDTVQITAGPLEGFMGLVEAIDTCLLYTSGVRELRKRLPHEDIIYFGDTGRVPYGSRSPETILQYARQDVAFLLSKNVKCIMAACGTVSSTYPAAEAAQLPVPYLGVAVSSTHLDVYKRQVGGGSVRLQLQVAPDRTHHPL